ncbi:MAG TPA: PQQ-binding-like beta-propeller repeat protein [Verrucomicrobiae bacterium]|jgi:outer membrane protein assembly factor BamB
MKRLCLAGIIAGTCFAGLTHGQENWPQFRGPNGDGHADTRGLPLNWSETNNVKWKTPIHGRSWSSPVIWGKQIWLTTATDDGKQLFAVCVDRDTGKIVQDLKVFEVEKQPDIRKYNTYASPTPVIEEGRVYVTFGAPGTACLDTRSGQVLWERRDLECNHFRGPGSSPILYGDLLFMNFDGSDHQFLIALDKKTGKTAWRKERSIDYKDLDGEGKPQAEGDLRKAFSTPHVAVFDGKPMLITQGAKAAYGHDPLTGREYWRVEERTSHSGSARAVAGLGMIFLNTGWSTGQILALRPGWNGQVLDANTSPEGGSNGQLQLVWKSRKSVPRKPSMLLVDDLLFGILDDGGMVSCLEAKSGQEIWRERIGGNYSASPLYAEGRIYFLSDDGKATILEAGRVFKKLAENKLDDGCMASPAVSGKALFVRTRTHLYRIEK